MILIIGAGGQVGQELTSSLREKHGRENVIASDIREIEGMEGPFEKLDAMDGERLKEIVKKHGIKEVYHLAALLSATAEKQIKFAWDLNMQSLFHVLELGKEKVIDKIFWPSSIAVFGPTTPKQNTPQETVTEPSTVYGISKLAGERWCEYYAAKFKVDVRSIRYPGLIGYKTLPGGGTTDYAVDIYHKALEDETYECFLEEHTYLPMMYMEDAIRATIEIMEAKSENIKIRSSYNLSAISFSPKEVAESIQREIPNFTISYAPDFRQKIAESWPQSIDDHRAREDWNWKEKYNLDQMSSDMLLHLKEQKGIE